MFCFGKGKIREDIATTFTVLFTSQRYTHGTVLSLP